MFKFSADDIASQSFETRFRGYDTRQVEEFLTSIAREWDHVVDEFKRMQIEVDTQSKELRDYRRRERSLVEALEMAKQVADEIRHQADRDAELVIAQTEIKAEKILAQAERRLAGVRTELFEMQQQRARFEIELRSTLEGHLKLMELMGARSTGELHPMPPVPKAAPSIRNTDSQLVDDADIEDADFEGQGGTLQSFHNDQQAEH
ncbi:MAG: DivIVA domain-containing protein [Bradymonadaceae bacterium]|nr:DivIVA domain-containing protein [Lujinxingiaceae bacterium]